MLANAEQAFASLTNVRSSAKGGISWHHSAAEAADGAQLIIESVPERPEIKRAVYAEIETTAASDAIITSSTSGIMPTELQAEMSHPERLMVAHPFNPVYLLPLVELVAGEKTDAKYIEWGKEFFAAIGMHPLRVRTEMHYLTNRCADVLSKAIQPAVAGNLGFHDRSPSRRIEHFMREVR